MPATASTHTQFVRRASLSPGESRCNFRQVDNDALRVVGSRQARKVTNLMMHIYMTLIDAPFRFRHTDGELYFAGEVRDGKHITAWEQLVELLEVADGTALKALRWLHEQGVIGYCARKNGAGIRIFINRAVASIKQVSLPEQKNLAAAPTANSEARTSPFAMPFKQEARKKIDTKINTFAPENGADTLTPIAKSSAKTSSSEPETPQQITPPPKVQTCKPNAVSITLPANVVAQLRSELKSEFYKIAAKAAAHEAAREGERTREWLDKHGIPKAARVAQREAYSVFKHQSTKADKSARLGIDLQVGRCPETYLPPKVKASSASEISEMAEVCITMLEAQGKAIEETLAEISAAAGGWVLAEDIPKVWAAAHALMHAKSNHATLEQK